MKKSFPAWLWAGKIPLCSFGPSSSSGRVFLRCSMGTGITSAQLKWLKCFQCLPSRGRSRPALAASFLRRDRPLSCGQSSPFIERTCPELCCGSTGSSSSVDAETLLFLIPPTRMATTKKAGRGSEAVWPCRFQESGSSVLRPGCAHVAKSPRRRA